MTKNTLSCVDCGTQNCKFKDRTYPDFCLTTNLSEEDARWAAVRYEEDRNHEIMVASAEVEYEGYCKWTRVQEIMEFARIFDIQGADALGRADFVAADGQQIHTEGFGGKGNVAEALHGVGVEQNILVVGLGGFDALGHGEDGAGFVVDQHHGHGDGVLFQSGLELLHSDVSGLIRLQIGDAETFFLQKAGGVEHGGVLHRCGDDMIAPAAHGAHGGAQRPVVPLGTAGGEE